MCVDVRMRIDVCVDRCADMRVDTWVDACADVRVGIEEKHASAASEPAGSFWAAPDRAAC